MSGLTLNDDTVFPSLAELMAELFDWNGGKQDAVLANDSLCEHVEIFSISVIPSPSPPTVAPVAPSLPLIGPLIASLMSSAKKRVLYLSLRPWLRCHGMVACTGYFAQFSAQTP